MKITLLSFGVLRQVFEQNPLQIEIAGPATLAELCALLANKYPMLNLAGVAIAVNQEFANTATMLNECDEVALLPPVSGGAPQSAFTKLTYDKIPGEQLIAAAKAQEDGAVLVFDGIVRNHSRNRQTKYLEYEAYETMAEKGIEELAQEALKRFAIRHVVLIHRLGRLEIGETSVLIIVASAHRAAAYDASRWLIDTLKKTVPIWKREFFVDGVEWAPGEPFPEELKPDAPGQTKTASAIN